MSKEIIHVDWTEVEELVADVFKMDEDFKTEDIENKLAEEYGISVDHFETIVQELFNRIDFAISPLTNTPVIGFGNGRMWFCKKKIDQQFIAGIISWLTEGENLKPGAGFIKEIITGENPEYRITIEKFPFKTK